MSSIKGLVVGCGSEIRIDSREIAELTGKEHKNVCRDIDSMLAKLEGSLSFGHTYIHPQNKQEYNCQNHWFLGHRLTSSDFWTWGVFDSRLAMS